MTWLSIGADFCRDPGAELNLIAVAESAVVEAVGKFVGRGRTRDEFKDVIFLLRGADLVYVVEPGKLVARTRVRSVAGRHITDLGICKWNNAAAALASKDMKGWKVSRT